MLRSFLVIILSSLLFSCMQATNPDAVNAQNVLLTEHSEDSYANNNIPDITMTNIHAFDVLFGGQKVGDANIQQVTMGKTVKYSVDYAFNNNGRGANSREIILINQNNRVVSWEIAGETTFGNGVKESFDASGKIATWQAAAGEGSASFDNQAMYIAQNASPYALFLYAKALLNSGDLTLPALPAGQLSMKKLETLMLPSKETGDKYYETHVYAITGIDLNPSYVVLDNKQQLVAVVSSRFAMMRKDLAHHDKMLRELAADYNITRFKDIAARATRQFEQTITIKNVRLFEPQSLSLSSLKSVSVESNKIINVQDASAPINPTHVIIDGNMGTLVPGLYEMHGHMSDNDALLNILAGVTSVRDMGNEKDVLDPLVKNIESGVLIGPRIIKSAFIEGKSPFSAATGEMAASEEEAVQLIKDYAQSGDYFQIKVYSSVNGDWVPAMAKEAKKHGMRVAGHIPAFSTADEMITAGFDEITHINQVMLSWVLTPEEDTRTLFRITGMKRFADLDVDSPKVSKTIDAMVANNIVVDPTIVIHEFGLTARNGETRTGARDYIDNMPIGVQRGAKLALLNVADEAEDEAYNKAFNKIIEVLAMMHKRNILIVPGTDLGGAFELHRELELFEKIGMSPAEVLKRASYDMANYLGYGEDLGSIETNKLADFFLVQGDPTQDLKAIKRISMVVKNGDVYFPSEVYPEFGIKPFAKAPEITFPE